MKTIKFITLIALAFIVANCLSCAPKAFPVGRPNPLDTEEDTMTASQRHRKNLRMVTGIPTFEPKKRPAP